MALVYFESSQLVLVVEKKCVGIVGKIGKSIGKHGFSPDSDAIWVVFVQQIAAADDFVSVYSTSNNHFHIEIFFQVKHMIKCYGLKYVWVQNYFQFSVFLLDRNADTGIIGFPTEFR